MHDFVRWIWLVLAFAAAGCASTRTEEGDLPASRLVSNVHVKTDLLPLNIKRVAVLPMAGLGAPGVSLGGEYTEELLVNELRKRALFELVPVSPSDLRAWTGRPAWSSTQELPNRFVERVATNTACDAVLFVELSRYQAYPPLAVGWKVLLVEAHGGRPLWAVDDVLDAGREDVASEAQAYGRHHLRLPTGSQVTMLQVPRRFATYAAWAFAGTAPDRHPKDF
jgi:hypothetical protein